MNFCLDGPDRHDNMFIVNSLACWDLVVMDEEDGVSTLDAVPYTLCQTSNVVGERCGPGVFIRSAYKLCVPLGYSCGGPSTPWKATEQSSTVSTVWLACANDRREYLWGGSCVVGSILSSGSGVGLGGLLGGTAGGTLGGAWGSILYCRLGSCTVVQVCLVGWVGFGGAPVVARMSARCQMESMVWVPKRAKCAAGAGFARASARRLAASMAASAEDMAGMAPLCGKN